MAAKVVNKLHKEEVVLFSGKESIILGVFHEENVAIVKDTPLLASAMAVIMHCAKKGIYYEGSQPESVVTKFIRTYGLTGPKKSWEPKVTISKESRLVLDLFGGEVSGLISGLGLTGVNSTPIIETMTTNLNAWTEGIVKYTKEDILNLASLVPGYKKAMIEPGNKLSDFKKFHAKGMEITFNEKGNTKGHYLHNLELKANTPRTSALIKQFKSKKGVFFAGASHITLHYMKNYGGWTGH